MATQPTLAMIPSGYKDGKLYSVLPSDGVGDFDVTRGSNATRINKDGLIETVSGNTPRLNYPLIDGVVSGCPSLLLEPQDTTILAYTNSYTDSLWSKQGTTINSNTIIGLDGLLSASVLARSTGVLQRLNQNMNLVIGNSYTISCYAKADADIYLSVGLIYNAGNYAGSQFNLNTGVVTRTAFGGTNYNAFNPKIESTGNGWYRCSVTVQTGIIDSYPSFVPSDTLWTGSAFNVTNVGDGVNGLFIQRTMMTNSLFLSSYIDNTTSGTTTRLADTANNAGNASTFNDSEGVLMMEGALLSELINDARISISDGSSVENRITFRYLDDNELSVQTGFTNGFSETVTLNSIEDYNKIALVYNSLNASIFVNGFKVATNTMSALSGLSQLQFNRFSGTANDFYGKTKQIQYYNTALTALELETLTSYTSFNAMALAQNYKIQ